MRILIVAPRFHTNLYFRVIALQQAGHQVQVAVLYRGRSEYYEQINITELSLSFLSKLLIRLTKLRHKSKIKTRWELELQSPKKQEVRRILTDFKPEFIILKAYLNLLAHNVTGLAKRRRVSIIMLTQTRKTHILGYRGLFKHYLSYLKRRNVIAYLTPTLLNHNIFKQAGISNVYYAPFVFPVQDFSKKHAKNDSIRIISIGKFVVRKDQILLLQAIEHLRHRYPVTLTLIGQKADETYLQSIKNYISQHKMDDIVKILVHLPFPEVWEQYKQHDLFVLPSYAEPAAYSHVEAMAFKLPVICSDDCGTSCYITTGENGELFKARNLNSLTESIEKIITTKESLKHYSETAYTYAHNYHNLSAFSEVIEKIIHQNRFLEPNLKL